MMVLDHDAVGGPVSLCWLCLKVFGDGYVVLIPVSQCTSVAVVFGGSFFVPVTIHHRGRTSSLTSEHRVAENLVVSSSARPACK